MSTDPNGPPMTNGRVYCISAADAAARIRAALKERTDRTWSVTVCRATGWITISTPPKCRYNGSMTSQDQALLADLLGLDRMYPGGEDVPASTAHRWEYIARAEARPHTRTPAYWD